MHANLQGGSATINVKVLDSCHPGYNLDKGTQQCVCDINDRHIVRCDGLGRYVYVRVSGVYSGKKNHVSVVDLITGIVVVGWYMGR